MPRTRATRRATTAPQRASAAAPRRWRAPRAPRLPFFLPPPPREGLPLLPASLQPRLTPSHTPLCLLHNASCALPQGAVGLSREDVYKAYSKGTLSSKKKKQAKLKREIVKARDICRAVSRSPACAPSARVHRLSTNARSDPHPAMAAWPTTGPQAGEARGGGDGGRRALQRDHAPPRPAGACRPLLAVHTNTTYPYPHYHSTLSEPSPSPPQGFAEKLFGRIHSGGGDSWDAKLLALQVLSRLVGMHKLQVLNFYPLLQRYVQPQQRDATKILACAAQVRCAACSVQRSRALQLGLAPVSPPLLRSPRRPAWTSALPGSAKENVSALTFRYIHGCSSHRTGVPRPGAPGRDGAPRAAAGQRLRPRPGAARGDGGGPLHRARDCRARAARDDARASARPRHVQEGAQNIIICNNTRMPQRTRTPIASRLH